MTTSTRYWNTYLKIMDPKPWAGASAAVIVGAVAVLVANGKTPPAEMVALARKLDLPLARTALSKFDAAVALGKALGA